MASRPEPEDASASEDRKRCGSLPLAVTCRLGDQIASTYDVLLARSARVIAIPDGSWVTAMLSCSGAYLAFSPGGGDRLLEGTATPALCRPAKTHVASERNHRKQS